MELREGPADGLAQPLLLPARKTLWEEGSEAVEPRWKHTGGKCPETGVWLSEAGLKVELGLVWAEFTVRSSELGKTWRGFAGFGRFWWMKEVGVGGSVRPGNGSLVPKSQ